MLLPADLSRHAAVLIERCPVIGDMLAEQFPVLILDEHQDASRSQHEIAMALRRRGARVRAFGDPMQTIFPAEDGFGWAAIQADAESEEHLATPYRWQDAPELGEWILAARAALLAGAPLPTGTLPRSVRIERVRVRDVRFSPGIPIDYTGFVRRIQGAGSGALLSARRNHAVTLKRAAAPGLVAIYEGSDFSHIYQGLEDVVGVSGSPSAVARVMLGILAQVTIGLTAARRARIEASLQDVFVAGRRHEVSPLLELFGPLYSEPNLRGAAQVFAQISRETPDWLRVERPAALTIFASVTETDGALARDQLHEIVAAYKSNSRRPGFAASTIHRAKGLEFDQVLVSNFSASHFPDTDEGRRLAYVAISRARLGLTLLVTDDNPSALI